MLAVVSNASEVNRERKVTVAARVPPDLAAAVARLADAADRTVARESGRAIREHVQSETRLHQVSTTAVATSSAVRSSAPSQRGEARAPQLAGIRPSLGGPDMPGPPAGAPPKEAA